MAFAEIYRGKKVLITGHTGFKGAWLAEWLLELGARVTGVALPPPTEPALFNQLALATRLQHEISDIRNLPALIKLVDQSQPDFIFHLAAQPLVRLSYEQPAETYATNVMGTVNVLEAVRVAQRACTVVAITTDKCYENKEWVHSYREEDPMGGFDPYSSSKGAAELAISAYRRSFFQEPSPRILLASARAGNVIGGGDWATDRIIPDCVRALQRSEPIPVRNLIATRPWQHVLEPLSGYLWLGACLDISRAQPATPLGTLASAFNFGPALTSNRTVADLVQEFLKAWPGRWEDRSNPQAPHEAGLLNLATDKAFHLLNWKSVWSFEQTVAQTANWYRQNLLDANPAKGLITQQITAYTAEAKKQNIAWAI